MKLLTIVIPSYNTESYIDKNMSTFLDKRLYNKVEVLIINDGSTDRTAELAGKYEKNYQGYIRLINKENGGHGSVINRGIKEAQGKYFKVVDADDWVNTENLIRLVSDLEKSDADLVVNSHMVIDQQTSHASVCNYKMFVSLSPESPFEETLRRGIQVVLHSITYKTSILKDNKIVVTEKCFYEDFQYALFPIPYIKTITVLDYPVYWYLIGQKTQSVSNINAFKNVEMSYQVFCDSIKYYNNHKKTFSKIIDNYFKFQICNFLRSIYNVYLRNFRVSGVIGNMLIMDAKIEHISPEFHKMVGEKNGYVRMLRRGKKIEFKILSIMFLLRKMILK